MQGTSINQIYIYQTSAGNHAVTHHATQEEAGLAGLSLSASPSPASLPTVGADVGSTGSSTAGRAVYTAQRAHPSIAVAGRYVAPHRRSAEGQCTREPHDRLREGRRQYPHEHHARLADRNRIHPAKRGGYTSRTPTQIIKVALHAHRQGLDRGNRAWWNTPMVATEQIMAADFQLYVKLFLTTGRDVDREVIKWRFLGSDFLLNLHTFVDL